MFLPILYNEIAPVNRENFKEKICIRNASEKILWSRRQRTRNTAIQAGAELIIRVRMYKLFH